MDIVYKRTAEFVRVSLLALSICGVSDGLKAQTKEQFNLANLESVCGAERGRPIRFSSQLAFVGGVARTQRTYPSSVDGRLVDEKWLVDIRDPDNIKVNLDREHGVYVFLRLSGKAPLSAAKLQLSGFWADSLGRWQSACTVNVTFLGGSLAAALGRNTPSPVIAAEAPKKTDAGNRSLEIGRVAAGSSKSKEEAQKLVAAEAAKSEAARAQADRERVAAETLKAKE